MRGNKLNGPQNVNRILVIAPSWVGDVVMATPAIRALRRQFPKSHITALATPAGADVLEHNPHLNRIIAANKKGIGPETQSARDLVRLLRQEQFDLAIIMPNSLRTALLAWRAQAKRRIGYAVQWRSILLTGRVPPPREIVDADERRLRRYLGASLRPFGKAQDRLRPGQAASSYAENPRRGRIVPINMVDRYLALCAKIGCTDLSKTEELFASADDIAAADGVLSSLGIGAGDRLVVLIPGASYGPAKLWGAEKFAAGADTLIERHGYKVLAHVGPGEEEIGRQVAAASARGVLLLPPPGAINLKTLKGVIKRSALVIANDTGPRHYAVAYGVPNVAILGPTSRRYIDVNLERTKLLQAQIECGPCQRKVCPYEHDCMRLITPDHVLDAVGALLAETQESPPS